MADSDVGPLAGATQNWTTLALMVVVGAIALASLYMGFTNYGEGNMETAFMYILIGVSGFVAIGFTFFKAKPATKTQDGPKEVEVVTTLECPEGMMTVTRINARKDPKEKKD